MTLGVLYKMIGQLDDLLLLYKIDLSIFDVIEDPDVIEHIQRVGVTFYLRDNATHEAVEADETLKRGACGGGG